MPTIEGVSCYISTATGKLPEYTDAETDGLDQAQKPDRHARPVRSCYIEAQADSEFSISIKHGSFPKHHPEATHFKARFKFDGISHRPKGTLINFSNPDAKKSLFHAEGVPGCLQTMKFAKLDLMEDGDADAQDPQFQHLGEIKILLYRWKQTSTKKSCNSSRTNAESRPTRTREVHEKELKGKDISLVVTGGAVHVRGYTQTRWTPGNDVDTREGGPYMTFRFLYRTERALKSLGLIPRTPSPSPTTQNVGEIFALSREELVARVVRLEAAQQNPTLKREPSGTFELIPPGREKKRRARVSQVTTIDLTDDLKLTRGSIPSATTETLWSDAAKLNRLPTIQLIEGEMFQEDMEQVSDESEVPIPALGPEAVTAGRQTRSAAARKRATEVLDMSDGGNRDTVRRYSQRLRSRV